MAGFDLEGPSLDPQAFLGRVVSERFRLDECIGRSHDALVFRAFQVNLRRDVAVKLLLAEPGGESQLGARLRREARLIASLRHSGIGEVYDEGVTPDGWPFIVMELLRGKTLRDYLTERGRLAPREAVEIASAVAEVVGLVHASGYIHRDLKPSNVFIEEGPHLAKRSVKVIDFGAVRRVDTRFEDDPQAKRTLRAHANPTIINTLPGMVIGTPHYMSPEQCSGSELDARSDVYSLGVVMYELLSGKLPFQAPTATGVMAAHLVLAPPPLAAVGVSVSTDLERAVDERADPGALGRAREHGERARTRGGADRRAGIRGHRAKSSASESLDGCGAGDSDVGLADGRDRGGRGGRHRGLDRRVGG